MRLYIFPYLSGHFYLSFSGVLVPGGFGSRGTEGKVRAAEWARKNLKPYLGEHFSPTVAKMDFECLMKLD